MIKCPSGNGYDYICTHMDDFKIAADDPYHYLEIIFTVLLVKSHSLQQYYLGNNYTFHPQHRMWIYSCSTYEKEALQKEIGSLGKGPFNHNQEGGRGRPNHYAITYI